jgi:2-amino-4-hydroxy-6-hydroxymethyldihydropteridine diphosphokinase
MNETVFIALGSNLGDRDHFLAGAREAIAALPATGIVGSTGVEETAPLGPVAQGAFLNQMIEVVTGLSPEELLDALLGIENRFGRTRIERWGPRTLDLDIVAWGERRIESERLTVPHPALADRDFWQRQLSELRAAPRHADARREEGDVRQDSASPAAPALPAWACVTPSRLEHIARVVSLLEGWAAAMRLDQEEVAAWRDAGSWHDALRDATEGELRQILPRCAWPARLLHGPAAAAILEREGETRNEVLEAIRYHTVGSPAWARAGKALYMADFLEPGRNFADELRASLAEEVPLRFDDVFREVVRMRAEWAKRTGKSLVAETHELLESVG